MSAPATTAGSGRFGRFELLAAERRLEVDGVPVPLGSRAFDLLVALVARRDRVVPKDELIDVVWPGLIVEDNNLQVQISALRKALGTQAIATIPGRGYQFTVAAAVVPPQAASETSPARMMRRASGTVQASRLLVADDNKVNRLLLCRSLELMGHEVTSVENGRAALERLTREPFDLLLLDLEMPELDGFGVLERREADPALHEIPVIVTSSIEGAANVARCLELGADDFLHKPVNPVLLKARVNSSLERKHLRDRQRELIARIAPGLDDSQPSNGAAAQRLEATLLSARLLDARQLASVHSPQDLMEVLSSWSTLMLDAVEEQGGVVTQLNGDRLGAVFGLEGGGAAMAASRAAREMQVLVAMFNAERRGSGKATINVGIGLASGEVVAGSAGTARRAAFACIGTPADRSRALADAATDEHAILIDAATRRALPDSMASRPIVVAMPTGEDDRSVHALT